MTFPPAAAGRLAVARRLAGLVALALVAAGCRSATAPPHAGSTIEARPRPRDVIALHQLRGAWRWLHVTEDDGTLRIERERWLFDPQAIDGGRGRKLLRGRYRRDLTVLALDGRSFVCNQRAAYVQSAVYDVEVAAGGGEVEVVERAYRTAASPCEHGFRRLGRYLAVPGRTSAVLTWDGGAQTLERLDGNAFTAAELEVVAPPSEPAARYAGAWHWAMRGKDRNGNVRDEDEAWQLAIGADGTAGGTYQRTVTVHAGDGVELPCAGATSYRFVDRYTLRGRLVDDLLSFDEVAVDAGHHPCLAATPTRHLDAATGSVEGEYLILTWRGKRRQVLHRE